MKNVLVLTGDRLGDRMAGPAIRAFEMGRCLARSHRVTVSCPEIAGTVPDLPDNLSLHAFGNEPVWRSLNDYDAVIIPASMHMDAHTDVPILVDLYDPFILSSLARSDKTEEKQVEERRSLMRNLSRGDFFVCASERQRDFWIGMLAAAGRVNVRQFQSDPHLSHLIRTAPFGIDETIPEPGPDDFPGNPDDIRIVWAGGIWDWFDPLTPIRTVADLNTSGIPVSLFFMGTGHPNPKMTRMTMVEKAYCLASELGLLNTRVFFGDWIPYSKRGSILAGATLGISTHFPHLETRYSYRTRILDYIWSRLPFICTDGDFFGDLAIRRRIGIAVPPEDSTMLGDAIRRMVEDTGFYRECKRNLSAVAQEMVWSEVLQPVMAFCENPHRSTDIGRPPEPSGEDADAFSTGCETATAAAGEILAEGLVQSFVLPHGAVYRIDVKLATYNRINTGYGIFELIDPEKQTIVRIPFDLTAIQDNLWHPFRFGPISAKSGSEWTIRISCPISVPGNAITAWVDETVSGIGFHLNGRTRTGCLNFRAYTREYSGSDREMIPRRRRFRFPWCGAK